MLGVFGIVVQGNLVGILALAAAINVVPDEAFFEGDGGAVVHMAVLTAAVEGTGNAA